jgi:arylsulfatase A-like enzyme
MPAATPPPYRSGLATGLGVVLLAGAVLGVVDVVHTGGEGHPAAPLLALWALIALPSAIGLGIVLGAGNATWGDRWVRRAFRRLRRDAELDRTIAAAMIAAALAGGVFALAIAKAAVPLVGDVQRKTVGALLLGVAVVAALPLLALAALPVYRVARRIMAWTPGFGPVSRVVLLIVGAAVAATTAGSFILFRRLDYQALNLASLFVPAMLPVIALAIALIAYGPLSGLRERIPRRGAIAAVAGAIAVALPLVALRAPSEATRTTVMERSYIGGRMITLLRKFIDRDGDGYSAFFGGPDCDDDNPDIHPNAYDIPGNGIDENCVGGDAKPPAPPPPPDAKAAPTAPAVSGGKNVLVIFIDTLRFDRLGVAGYRRDGKSLTPRLDELAAQSVMFTHAYAQAPNTPRSVPSFLTSRYSSQVRVDKKFKNYATVLDDNDTLFEALKAGGFTTIGESSHFYFCDRKRYPDSCSDVAAWMKPNMIQGADEWDNSGALNIPESNHDSAGPRIVKKSIARLGEAARAGTRFAMLVHLFEPHSTYMEHEGFRYHERGTAALAQKYDYEIAFEDRLIGELLDALDTTGLAKTTTVVVMSDHGEAFGVHVSGGKPAFFHGDTLYRELIHVPLMFRVPGGKPCRRDDVVQLIDMAPTIAALFGVAAPASWQGRSLAPAVACQPLEPRAAFSELLAAPEWDHDAKSMITADGKHHVYYRTTESRWEIYDLDRDPDEKTNLADQAGAAELEQALTAWIEGPLAGGGGK